MEAKVTRRQVLEFAIASGVGLAATSLAACTGSPQAQSTQVAPAQKAQPTQVAPATAAPAPAATAKPAAQIKRGGTMRVATMFAYPTLDPHISSTSGNAAFPMLFDPLIGYKYNPSTKGWDLKPMLATSWEIPEPTTVVLKLREGVKFSDGSPWNADVCAWNLLRIKDHPKSWNKTLLDSVNTVTVVDPITVKLTLKRPSAGLLANLSEAGGAQYMISKANHEKYGDNGIVDKPVGTGPMVLERWVRDSVVELKRREDYWQMGVDGKPLPYIDRYQDYFRPDPTVSLGELRSGQLDILQEPDPKDRAAVANDPNIVVVEHPSAGYGYFGYGLSPKVDAFKDVRVRMAFNYGLDRASMVKAIGFGYGKPHWVRRWAPGVVGYEEGAFPTYEFNPQKAKQLLAEAGYPNGLDVSMQVINRALDMSQAEMVKAIWEASGIRITLDVSERLAWVDKMQALNFQVSSHRPQSFADPEQIRLQEMCGAPGNWFGWCNKEFDSLMEQGGATYDPKQRHELYKKAIKVMVEDNWTSVAYMAYLSYLVSKRVKDFDYNWVHQDHRRSWLES